MTVEIVNRTRELEQLAKCARSAPSLVILRGRRRIGKSYLLRAALPGKRVVSLQAEQKPAVLQLEAFAQECQALLPGYPPFTFRNWGEAFEFIEQRAVADGPLVVVLDEFQFLAAQDAALPSTIQRFWDRWDHKRIPVMLVLSGSALSFMEGLLGGGQPLFGRSEYRPLLLPLLYTDTPAFAPAKASPASIIERFAVLGGTPQYQVWGGARPLRRVITEAILPPDVSLHAEPEHLIREEQTIREPGPYFAILEAIATRYTTPTEIAGRLQLKQQQITQFLDRLEELAYVARVQPLEPRQKGAARSHWKIADPFFRFWFRYVLPNRSKLARGRIDEVADIIQADLSTFVGLIFEDCCRDWVGRFSDLGSDAIEVGSWWSRKNDVEIDVVTTHKKGYGLLGSCKWWSKPVGLKVLDDLLTAQSVLGAKAAHARLAIFSKAGFTPELVAKAKTDDIALVDAEALFQI